MHARPFIAILIVLLLAGCSEKVDTQSSEQRLQACREMIAAERATNEAARAELQAQMRKLENKVAALESDRKQEAQVLAARIALLEKKSAPEDQERLRRAAEERKRQATLEAMRKAKRSEAPFRIFDVRFVGKQTHDGRTCDYGTFSVRNNTAVPLKIHAASADAGVRVNIPANGSETNVYVPAAKDRPLKITTDQGAREYTWGR